MQIDALVSVSSQSVSKLVTKLLKRAKATTTSVRGYYNLINKSRTPRKNLIVISDTVGNYDGYVLARKIKNFDANNTKKVVVLNLNRRVIDETAMKEKFIYPLDVPFTETSFLNIISEIREDDKTRIKEKKVLLYTANERKGSELVGAFPRERYDVAFVSDFNKLEETIYTFVPDVMIVDLDRYRQEIYQLCFTLRLDDNFVDTPITLLTKRNLIKERIYGFNFGAIDYIASPVEGEDIVDHVETLLANIASPGNNKILVVSHHSTTRHILSHLLAQNRFAYETAHNNELANEMLKKGKIDSIILDIDEKESEIENAIAFVQKLRNNHKFDNVSIIAVVTRETMEVLYNTDTILLNDYIIKPFDEMVFIKRLKNNLIFINVIDNLEYQNRQLNTVNKKHSELLAFTMYDIKNPVSLIRNYAKYCRGQMEEQTFTAEEMLNALKTIERQASVTTRIIESTLSEANIDTGKLALTKTNEDVVAILASCLEDNVLFLENKNLNVRMKVEDDIPEVKLDKVKVYEVFTNLLHHSIKHSKENGKIVISVSILDYQSEFDSLLETDPTGGDTKKKLNKYVEIRFVDAGRTLSETIRKRIFNKIVKSEHGSAQEKNLNLGMHIARNIVNAHNGKIWVENTEEETVEGNAFIVLFPLIR